MFWELDFNNSLSYQHTTLTQAAARTMEWTCRCYHFRMQKPGEGSASSLPTYLKIHLKGTLSIMTLFSWYINYVPAGMMLAGLFFTLLARRKLPGGRYQAGLPPQNTWQPASWEVPMGATGSLQARGETQSPAPQKLLFQYKFLWQICNKWTARRSMGVKCLRAVKGWWGRDVWDTGTGMAA